MATNTKAVAQMLPTYHVAAKGKNVGQEVPTWVSIVIDSKDDEANKALQAVKEAAVTMNAAKEGFEALIIARHGNSVPPGHVLKTSFLRGFDNGVMGAIREDAPAKSNSKTGFRL
jgi:hypothetical protein